MNENVPSLILNIAKLSIYLSTYLPIYLSIYLSIYPIFLLFFFFEIVTNSLMEKCIHLKIKYKTTKYS